MTTSKAHDNEVARSCAITEPWNDIVSVMEAMSLQ